LIPGPLAHFSTTDCLVITNSNFEIESYRYNSLQAFTTNNINQQRENFAQNDQASKLKPEWLVNLGE